MSPDVSVTVRRQTEEYGGERGGGGGGGRGGVQSKSSNTAQRVGRPVVPTLELGKLTREETAICPSIHALHHMQASEQEKGASAWEDEEVEDPLRLRRKMSPPVHVNAVDVLLQLEVRKLQSVNDKQARELVANSSAFSHHADLVLTRRGQRQESRANSNSTNGTNTTGTLSGSTRLWSGHWVAFA